MTEQRDSDRRLARHRIAGVVRGVRWRWRARLVMRGLLWVGGLTAAVLFLSALGLERARFAAEWVTAFRFLTWGTFLVSLYLFLVRPLMRRVTDNQVALYLEEHEPSLEQAVVSALDESASAASPVLGHRVVEVALERAKKIEYGRRVEQSNLYRFAGALTALALVALSLSLFGPQHLRHGLAALLMPTVDAADVNPYAIAVAPCDVTIPRNSDQTVTAALSGFDAADVSIFTKGESEQGFRRLSMLPGIEDDFEVMLVAIGEKTEYFISSTGIRTPTFTIDVADLPYVDQLDLTYYYPSYTGLPARVVEDGGDVAALPGTVVEVRITPTMDAPTGQLLLDSEAAGELTRQDDGSFVTRFTVGDNLFYSIELARANGQLVPASPEYTIDVLNDRDPAIQFTRPGRDEDATALEEVYLEMNATDDYGIRDVRLVYSVNAGPEDTIAVFETGGAPLSEVSAGHTLFLEEWELEPGDLVSYYAVARDNRTGEGSRPITSDIYFLNIRPFERAYRQSEQGGGGGGGGGGQQQETPLSDLQRQVIAATFNLIRQRDSYAPGEFSENVNSVALAQGRLIGQVGTLLQRMENRGLTQSDPGFRDVSAVLPLAIEAMQRAAEHLGDEELQDAMPDEQEALRRLQQAEETYEQYVQQQQGGGGGGGGGGSRQAAEDLADLFELELDQLQNQYETVERGQAQQADNEVDELLEQLQELARRQEQEAERQRRRAQQQAGGGGGGGQSQRDLAAETEEAARQLERLARQMNDPELQETARSLMDAAQSMREAAAQSGGGGSTSEAQSALQRLEEARRELEDQRSGRAQRDTQEALDRIAEMQAEQRDIQRDVRNLPTDRGTERTEQIEQLRERKDQMEQEVIQLERDLDQAAASARADNPEAARGMQTAANTIRETELREKIRFSRNTIEQWDPQSATTLELNIEADLQSLRDQLESANQAASDVEPDPLEDALDETRNLVRGMEAMSRRLNEPGQQGQQGQGQQGDQQGQGQQGDQQGQGQQGDQQGQGQQGQGQQGDQQGQGQQGQGQQGQGQQGQQGQGQGQGQQGQGQQGGGQQGGQQQGGFGGGFDNGGFAGGGNTYDDYRNGGPRQMTDEELRQYRAQMEQRAEQMRDLRQDLRAMGRPVDELDRVLDSMTRLDDRGVITDPRALAEIHQGMLDQLKRMEFTLRREVEGETGNNPTLTGSDDVPDGYRTMVEEYYRALARGAGPSN